ALGVCLQRPRRHPLVTEGQEHLAGRGCMRDARAAESRDTLHGRRALHEVDRDCVELTRRRESCGLAGRLDERLEVRAGDLSQVEAGEHDVAELKQSEPEAIATGV